MVDYVNLGTIEFIDANGVTQTKTVECTWDQGALSPAESWAKTRAQYFPDYHGPEPTLLAQYTAARTAQGWN